VNRTTAWNEGQKKCEKILLALKKSPDAEMFCVPPQPRHPFYTEIMTDYIDLSIMESNLKNGCY
jgi:hypothetical protein